VIIGTVDKKSGSNKRRKAENAPPGNITIIFVSRKFGGRRGVAGKGWREKKGDVPVASLSCEKGLPRGKGETGEKASNNAFVVVGQFT